MILLPYSSEMHVWVITAIYMVVVRHCVQKHGNSSNVMEQDEKADIKAGASLCTHLL